METDKYASCAAAKRDIAPALKHRAQKGLNNRAENSHLAYQR
ncbi:putative transposase [Palleronia aestuarii]|uniref:Putative transposase n=1 Tax=Palleronia aestuarii TaxID=568105 RepID=A0A2W7NGI7_9RHOB|nr:putative transposase [Palleronia aestuarii]